MTQQRPNREQRRQERTRQPSRDRAEARYLRSNLCRVIRVDGGHGGVTAQGGIHLGIYVERTMTPDSTIYILDHEKRTASEELRGPTNGWIREIEADLIFTKESAIAIRNWLNMQIKRIEDVEAHGGAFDTIQKLDTTEAQ